MKQDYLFVRWIALEVQVGRERECEYNCFGGAKGIQTLGLCNANAALYQLSYSPMSNWFILIGIRPEINPYRLGQS